MARLDKEDAENTLASEAGEEDFLPASKAFLGRAESKQSKFAETISGVTGMDCGWNKETI